MRFQLTNDERKTIIDYLENICKKNTIFSPNTISILLRAFHINTPNAILFTFLFCNGYFVTFAGIFLLLCYLSWIPFRTCFLSMLENRLFDDDFNIADPFLEFIKMEKNKKNRTNVSYIIGTLYLLVILCIAYYRFYYKKNINIQEIN
jgi:hypothetical protein